MLIYIGRSNNENSFYNASAVKTGSLPAASVAAVLCSRALILWWRHVLDAADLWALGSNTWDNGAIITAECCVKSLVNASRAAIDSSRLERNESLW